MKQRLQNCRGRLGVVQIIFAAFLLVIILQAGYYFWLREKLPGSSSDSKLPAQSQETNSPSPSVSVKPEGKNFVTQEATASADQAEENSPQVDITAGGIKPKEITISKEEKVVFYNKTDQEVTVRSVGSEKGMSISAGRTRTIHFNSPDRYHYEVIGFNNPLEGTIIIK